MYGSLDEARDHVLIDNTAQAVFKELQALEHNRSSYLARWIWELVQNARDAASNLQTAEVKVCLTTKELSFSHNGSPFTPPEIAHLIYHGSTKQGSQGSVGQFGTGFLTTHIISRRIRIKGFLKDNKQFDFILDRTGDSPEALSSAMRESWEQFKRSLLGPETEANGEYTTEFIYPVTEETFSIGNVGLEDLERNAPYVLAFNATLSDIEIEREGRVVQLARNELDQSNGRVHVVSVSRREHDKAPTETLVAVTGDAEISVALCLQRQNEGIYIATDLETPKIYLAFPLIDTKDFAFPVVINSLVFTPNEDRGGIWLGKSEDEANITNQKLLGRALSLTSDLLVYAIENDWHKTHIPLRLPALSEKPWLGVEWYSKFVSDLIERVRLIPILRTADDDKSVPRQAWIPISPEGIDYGVMWVLVSGLSNSLRKLATREVAQDWQGIYHSWAAIQRQSIENYEECITLKKLVKIISGLKNVKTLQAELIADTDTIDWLNQVYELILKTGKTNLFDEMELLPDQTGAFHSRSQLFRDSGVDDQLKNIADRLGLNVRASLLDSRVRLGAEHDLLPQRTEREVLTEALEKLKGKAAKETSAELFRHANVELFTWMMTKEKWESFGDFPALSEVTSEGESPVVRLTSNTSNPDDIPLAPYPCWPKNAQPYAELFPKRYLLSRAYYERCSDDSLWATLADKGYCRVTPMYQTEDRVDDFLPDEPLPDRDKGLTHKLAEPASVTAIAFLVKKDMGLIDTARGSRTRALILLNFLVAFALDADLRAFDMQEGKCECSKTHRYYRAKWLAPLKKRKWIPLKSGASEPTADSLAQLIAEDVALVNEISEGKTASLLEAIGVSVADLLLRTVAGDEHARTSLTRSATDLLHAAGGSIEKVRALAQAIKDEPKLLEVIEREKQTREKIHRNQAVGQQVENLLRSSFEKEGIQVTRTGIGSDFEVEHDLVESGTEMAFEIHKTERRYLIEVKATTDLSVRMTVTQGFTATQERDRFILCIVRLKSADVGEADIRERARFISNIGDLIEPLYEEYKRLDTTRRAATTKNGDIELEMTESQTRFRVGVETWSSGKSFDEIVRQILGVT